MRAAFGEPVVAREIVHRHVVLVDPLAGRNRAGGEPDDLAELAHRLAVATGAVAILWPRGTRSRAVTFATVEPGPS